MQPNDGKDNHEEQDEASNGQEGCRRCQQYFSDLTQALQQQHKLYDPGVSGIYQALHNQHSFDELGNLPGFAEAPQILHPRKLTRFCRSVHLWEHVSRCILSREDNTSAAVSACVITLFMPAYYAEKKGQGRAQAIWHHSCCLYPHESSPARLNTRSQVVA